MNLIMDRFTKNKERLPMYIFTCMIIIIIAVVTEASIKYQASLQKVVWVILALLGFAMFFYKVAIRKTDVEKEKAMFLIANFEYLPFVVAFLYTACVGVIMHEKIGMTQQAFTTMSYLIVDMIAAYFITSMFKEKSINVMFYAIALSYGLTLIFAFNEIGLNRVFEYFFGQYKGNAGYFEKNDIGVAVVPLILMYIYMIINQKKDKRNNIIKLVFLVLILIMCGKRSAFTGTIVGVVIIALFAIFKNKNKLLSIIVSLSFILGAFLYVCFIKYGVLEAVCKSLSINSMGRLSVYTYFNDQYKISLLYMGKGFQYVHRYMEAGLGNDLVNTFSYLHNSILQIYIETGFCGFFLWFSHILIGGKMLVRKIVNDEAAIFYLILAVSMVTIFATDNVLTYPVYQLTQNITILNFVYREKVKSEECNNNIEL